MLGFTIKDVGDSQSTIQFSKTIAATHGLWIKLWIILSCTKNLKAIIFSV